MWFSTSRRRSFLVVGLLPRHGVFGGEDQIAAELCALSMGRGWDAQTCGELEAASAASWCDPDLIVGLSCPVPPPRPKNGCVSVQWHFNERVTPSESLALGWDVVVSSARVLASDEARCVSARVDLAALQSCSRFVPRPPIVPRKVCYVGNATSFKDPDDARDLLVPLAEKGLLVLRGAGWDTHPCHRELARAWHGSLEPSEWSDALTETCASTISFATPKQRAMGCVCDRVYCCGASGSRVLRLEDAGGDTELPWVTTSPRSEWLQNVQREIEEASIEDDYVRAERALLVAREHSYGRRLDAILDAPIRSTLGFCREKQEKNR